MSSSSAAETRFGPRFGPKRVVADMEGNGELIFERFIRIFGDILEDFWAMFEEFWRN